MQPASFRDPGSRNPSGQSRDRQPKNQPEAKPALTAKQKRTLDRHVMSYIEPWNQDIRAYPVWIAVEFHQKGNLERFLVEKASTGKVALCPMMQLVNTVFLPLAGYETAFGCFLGKLGFLTTFKPTEVRHKFHMSEALIHALGQPGAMPNHGWYKATTTTPVRTNHFSDTFAPLANIERLIIKGVIK